MLVIFRGFLFRDGLLFLKDSLGPEPLRPCALNVLQPLASGIQNATMINKGIDLMGCIPSSLTVNSTAYRNISTNLECAIGPLWAVGIGAGD